MRPIHSLMIEMVIVFCFLLFIISKGAEKNEFILLRMDADFDVGVMVVMLTKSESFMDRVSGSHIYTRTHIYICV